MKLACLLKPIAQICFLIQYYLLFAIILAKNILRKLFFHCKIRKANSHIDPLTLVHPHVFVHSHDLIRHDEFTFQIYEAETQDHAFVSLWRLRHKDQAKWNNQNPILIQHGLLDCSMSWFLHEQKSNSLPFILAEQGYDVWIGNNRGTVFSDKNSQRNDYWDFNIDHFVKYDQPALINKVLQETEKEKLIYIGHSQGSTQFLLGQGENRELQEKIEKFIGLGTVISLENLKNHTVLDSLSKYYAVQILQILGFKSVLALPKWMNRKVGVLIYNFGFYLEHILGFIISLCGKTQRENIDPKRLGIFVAHEPGGTSVQNVKHWIQIYRSKKFRKFDYGCKKNKIIYGTEEPPEYDLKHMKDLPFKSYIFRGTKDAVIHDKDFKKLIDCFREDNVEVHEVHDYGHVDYAWAVTAKNDIYDKIVNILRNQKSNGQLHSSSSLNTDDTSEGDESIALQILLD